ncbi:tyrosine-type recombinase/integrase (plasmid) [Roseivivax marinus]|uniref:tyrosine-type recombinase/integrase n=1 Tax=Roseivivax marinus TaxID=1379903 RepID=UPI001F043C8B|nr:tyrosine-type recombinase/integrase [Roseivivax marinus]UMA67287.1 tyrosine-type recombinase/integrase [Roseivivax marinus]
MTNVPAIAASNVPAEATPDQIAARLSHYQSLAQGAFSPNTLRAIKADTAVFQTWAADNERSGALPLDPETVAAFVSDMGEARKPATVSRYVSSLDHLHRAAELAPVGATNAVRLALRAVRRDKGTAQKQAKPMRRAVLDAALDGMSDSPKDTRDAALLSVGYDSLARSSELVAIRVQDVTCQPDGSGRLYIAKSKTDQEGAGSWRYLAPDTMARVAAWVQAAGHSEGEPLFLSLGPASDGAAISTRDVLRIFKSRLGVDYSTHSARVGGAKDQLDGGVPIGKLAESGGWKSLTMPLRYGADALAGQSGAAMLAQKQGRA